MDALTQHLSEAVTWARIWVREKCDAFERETEPKLDKALDELETLKKRQFEHLEYVLLESAQAVRIKEARFARRKEEIEQLFSNYLNWVQDTMCLETEPWIKVLGVVKGEEPKHA